MAKNAYAVVFIHGLARKPEPTELMRLWRWGLERDNPMPAVFVGKNMGIKLGANGVESLLCYYADVFYDKDYETDFRSYYEKNASESDLAADGLIAPDADLPPLHAVTPREQLFLRAFETQLGNNLALVSPADETLAAPASAGYEIAGFLPAPVREAIIKKAAKEAYYYLFDKEYKRADGVTFQVRRDVRQRFMDALAQASASAEKVVVVSHSMGTMIAYDVLRNCPECVPVDTLITIGSPLGVREVQEELKAIDARQIDFPAAKLANWINIYDPLDPVCGADPRFANDYLAVDGKAVIDVKESNWGGWRHTVTHYLAGTKLRAALAKATGLNEA